MNEIPWEQVDWQSIVDDVERNQNEYLVAGMPATLFLPPLESQDK